VGINFHQDTRDLERAVLGDYSELENEHYARAQRLAATMIRRQANQHGCREESTRIPCDHEDHRRDRFYAEAMLEALGVPRDLPRATDDDRTMYLNQDVHGRRPSDRQQRRWAYEDYSNGGRFK